MQLHVRTFRGSTVPVDAPPNLPVAALKALLEATEGAPAALQRLFYNGRELAGCSALAECGIGEGAVLYLRPQQPTLLQPGAWQGALLRVRLMDGGSNQCIGHVLVSGVNSSDTVAQLKAHIKEQQGIAVERQVLCIGRCLLLHGATLHSCGVQPSDVLDLYLLHPHVLHQAVALGNLANLEKLLAAGAARQDRDTAGGTPLLAAARAGQAGSLRVLLAFRADKEARSRSGKTTLHLAAEAGHVPCVGLLLAAGADPQAAVSGTGDTAVHLAAAAGQVCALGALLGAGADKNATNSGMQTALASAVAAGRAASVELLLAAGAEKEARASCGHAPLHHAAMEGRLACVEALLLAGADKEARDNHLRTPLHLAAVTGSLACLETLIQGGADLEAADAEGRRPLHLAAPRAVLSGRCAAALLKAGACKEARNSGGETPVLVAAGAGAAALLQMLLEARCSHSALTSSGRSALQLAALSRSLPCVRLLLAHSADANATDHGNATPLHAAARAGSVDCIRALLAAGSDIKAVDADGWTPALEAAAAGQPEAMLAIGGNLNLLDSAGSHCLHYLMVQDSRPVEPRHLHALLAAGVAVALACEAGQETPLDFLLLAEGLPLPDAKRHAPELTRILVAAGCPVDVEGHSTAVNWFQEMAITALDYGWPSTPDKTSLAVSAELLRAAAAEHPAGRPSFLFDAIATGSLELVQMVLAAFPHAGSWRVGRAGYSPLQMVLLQFSIELQVHNAPGQELLAAGCPPVLGLEVLQATPGRVTGGPGRVEVPAWAHEPLRHLLPLVAAGGDWAPEHHVAYPPAFRAAARALLLVNECRGVGERVWMQDDEGCGEDGSTGRGKRRHRPSKWLGGGAAAALRRLEQAPRGRAVGVQLPPELLHRILHLAACPLPVWVPQLHACVAAQPGGVVEG